MSVIALGAGGISKRLFAEQDKIERAANVNDIKNYVERTAEMANSHLAVSDFASGFYEDDFPAYLMKKLCKADEKG